MSKTAKEFLRSGCIAMWRSEVRPLCSTYRIGVYYNLLPSADVLPQATKMAVRALELDPYLAEPHVAMAHIKRLQWDWAGMEEEYQCALKINPNATCKRYLCFTQNSSLTKSTEIVIQEWRAMLCDTTP